MKLNNDEIDEMKMMKLNKKYERATHLAPTLGSNGSEIRGQVDEHVLSLRRGRVGDAFVAGRRREILRGERT